MLSKNAKIEKAKIDLRTIADTVAIYLVSQKADKLPSMETLTTPDEKGKTWLDIKNDPWGNKYLLCDGERLGKFEVICSGPDGLQGTEDDIFHKR